MVNCNAVLYTEEEYQKKRGETFKPRFRWEPTFLTLLPQTLRLLWSAHILFWKPGNNLAITKVYFHLQYQIFDDVIRYFNWPNPFSHTWAQGSTQPLAEVNTRNLPGRKGRPARKANNLTAIYGPIVWKMWKPRRLTLPWASATCYRSSCTFYNMKLWKQQVVPEDEQECIMAC
jgi:hypothetical protein